ncbi:PAS domain S-box protein [Lacihabitans sp. CCS-44]|uniref:PAS domain S-box protein n=1 Tax=Lacihabitans sp. CCS-44 TaxID=2487331 RepID=UPI0020CF7CD9|nr:PAS domain S-box protein [Lacihabitans sp. CCS-44]
MVLLYIKLKISSKSSVDLRKLSLDRNVGHIEEELLLNPTHFNRFLELSNFGIWQYQINTGLLKINNTAASLFGFQSTETVNLESLIKLMVGTFDVQGLVATFQNTLLTKTVHSNIIRIRRPDGSELFLNVKMVRANHYSNQPVIIGNIQEIDQRPPDDYFQKQFYLLAENTSDGIYIFEQGVLTYLSEKLKNDFEIGFFENRNVSVEDLFAFIHPDDIANVKYKLERASLKRLTKFRLKFRLLINNGTTKYREDILYNFYDEKGGLQRTLIVAKDVTDLKKAKQSINFEAILSMGLVENFPGLIAVKNYEGEFIFANKNSATIFGINPGDVLGRKDDSYNSDPNLIQKYLEDDRKVIESEKSLVIPKEAGVRIGGGFGYFQTIKIPIDIPGQKKKCVLLFSIDITERVRLENLETERKNALALRNQILYDLSNNAISFEKSFLEKCKILTEALAKGLNIEFSSIWEVRDNQIICLDSYSNSAKEHKSESPLSKKLWQSYLDILKNNLELVLSDVSEGPLRNESEIMNGYYLKNNIKSSVDIPLRLGEQFKGVICCEHTSIREWSSDELAFIRHIGNIKLALWEQELRKDAERKLLERSEILRVTAEVSQILQKTNNLESSLGLILQKIGGASKSSRVYYFTNVIEKGYFKQMEEWVGEGVKSEMDNPALQSLEYSKIGKYYQELVEGRPFQLVISDIKDPEHYQRLFLQDIKSQLVIPVVSRRELLGYIGFDDCKEEKNWSDNYINLLLSIGASIGSAIEKLENEKLKEESQENFKQVSDTLEEVFWLFDIVNSKFLLISKACFDIFGVSEKEGYDDYQFIEKLILEEDFSTIDERKNGITNGIYNEINYRIKTPAGDIKVINEKISPIFDKNGELVKISGIARDVTIKVSIDNEIRRLSIVAQKINNGVLISDVDSKAIWANNAYLRLFQIELGDLLGNRPSELFNTDSLDFILENSNLNSKNLPIEFKVQTFKGSWIWVEMTSTILYDSSGNVNQIVEIITDITERKRNEIALRDNESRLRFITDNTSDGFMIFRDNEIVYYSSQCEKLFGYTWPEVELLSISEIFDFIHKEDIEVLNNVVIDIPNLLGKDVFFELRARHKNGRYFWIEVVVNVVMGDDNNPISSVVVIRNIDARKNMELALKDNKQMLNIILNSLDEVVWAREYPSLKPLFVSESIKNIYGISSNEWKKGVFQLNDFALQDDQEIVQDLMSGLHENSYSNGTFRIKDRSGQLKWIFTSSKIVSEGNFGNTMVIGILKDVTKIKDAENETQIAKHETEIAQNAYSELELRALQMQMNPHFIFNALNSIQSYIINKEEQMANVYLTKFAALIRQFLDSSRSKYISLDEEIANLKLYVELEKLRFENKFDYVFEFDPKVNKYNEIPTMLLQPFIENAINHGLRYKSSKGLLRVSFLDNDKNILVRIEDNGVGRKAAEKIKLLSSQGYKSQGLKITTDRIANYNKLNLENIEYKISDLLENSENIGTLVEIYFPKL